MNIDHPQESLYPAMMALWQKTFGDPLPLVQRFFRTAFLPEQTLCATENGAVLGAVYWIDCARDGEKWAYIYALAVDESARGQGIGKFLMNSALEILKKREYTGALLMPGEDWLWEYYGAMGFLPFGGCQEVQVRAQRPIPAERIRAREYFACRKALLPEGSICQKEQMLEYLAGWLTFYRGEGFVCAAQKGTVAEFLGDPACLEGVVAALGADRGVCTLPGAGKYCGMYRPFTDTSQPRYFGLAGM